MGMGEPWEHVPCWVCKEEGGEQEAGRSSYTVRRCSVLVLLERWALSGLSRNASG